MSRTKGIGPVPEGLGSELDQFLTQVRRILIDAQAGRILSASTPSGSSMGTPIIIDGGGGSEPTSDYTVPPNVSGATVSAGLDFVFVTTDAPTFTAGHGYNRTLVYGATYPGTGPLPTFGDAVIVHEFVGQVGSFPSEAATQWHIWLKWRTNDGVLSASPAGGTNGYTVTTGQDVSLLLEALTGSIRASELQAALSARIDLIDADASVPGSVSARVLTEKTERIAGDSASASAITSVNARLNVGGDSYSSIVQAQNTATAAQTTANTAASSVTTVQSRINRVVNYRIQAKGFSATVGSFGMFTESGTNVFPTAGRGYNVVVLNGSNGNVVSTTHYDTYANAANATAMAAALDGLGADSVVVVFTNDEPQGNVISPASVALQDALKNCGASQITLDRIKYRGAYILVGIPDSLEGAGIEKYAGDTNSATNAWTEYSLQLLNGRPVALGGNPIAASVQQEITTRAAIDGHISSLYAVRVQTTEGGRTVMGGFGIMGTSGGTAGPTIDFGVLANRFYIGAPVGDTGVPDIQPFTVITTPTTINGVSVPVGAYMDAAYILRGTITSVQIGNATITDAKIVSLAVDKLLAGSLAVGQYIQSSNFVSGTSGFRIQADGNAYFNNVSVRGEVNGGAFTGYAWPPSGTGFHLGPSGLLLGNYNTGGYFQVEASTGNVYAPGFSIIGGNATFSGALSGAIVTSSNIAARAVLAPNSTTATNTIGFTSNTSVLSAAMWDVGSSATVPIFVTLNITQCPYTPDTNPQVTTVDIKRDGSVIFSLPARPTFGSGAWGSLFNASIVDYPSSGAHTYSVHLTATSGSNGQVSQRSLHIIGYPNTAPA